MVERYLAAKLATFAGWTHETGLLMAGVVTTASFSPLKKSTNVAVTAWLDRVLPPRRLEDCVRVSRVITFSDLSGYSALAARDEAHAVLLASVLQRQARQIADRHQGRLVKGLGDAVIMEFQDAGNGVDALRALHEGFAASCKTIPVEPLPLHSGADMGEVFLAPDGDVYGATVNLAARLQDVAKAHEIVVSGVVQDSHPESSAIFDAMGEFNLKSIPAPIACFRVTTSE